MSILVIAEVNKGNLAANTLNVVTAAQKIGGTISILVAGSNISQAEAAAAQIAGVNKVLSFDDEIFHYDLAENTAALVTNLVKEHNFGYVLAAATSFGRDYLPRAAALLDCEQISAISEVIDANTFVRPIYAGNILATVQSNAPIKVISVRTTSFAAAANTGGAATITAVKGNFDVGKSKFIGQQFSTSDRPELTDAKVIIGGGRGLQNGENFNKLLYALADKLGGAVGATRAAVDAGFVANDLQIGWRNSAHGRDQRC